MKTLTYTAPISEQNRPAHIVARAARVAFACIFATSIALSETTHSTVQYGVELENKQASLTTIREDTSSIEGALMRKIEAMKKRAETGRVVPDLAGQDIASLLPAAPQPAIGAQTTPFGTLSPQTPSRIIDRGLDKKRAQ